MGPTAVQGKLESWKAGKHAIRPVTPTPIKCISAFFGCMGIPIPVPPTPTQTAAACDTMSTFSTQMARGGPHHYLQAPQHTKKRSPTPPTPPTPSCDVWKSGSRIRRELYLALSRAGPLLVGVGVDAETGFTLCLSLSLAHSVQFSLISFADSHPLQFSSSLFEFAL